MIQDSSATVGAVLRALRRAYGTKAFRAQEAVATAGMTGHTSLHRALVGACGASYNSLSVAKWLSRHRDAKVRTLRLIGKHFANKDVWAYRIAADDDKPAKPAAISNHALAEMHRSEDPRPAREPKPAPFVDELPPPGPAEGAFPPPGAFDRVGQTAPTASSEALAPVPEPPPRREILQVDAGAAPRYLPPYTGAGPERGIFPPVPVSRRWTPFD